MESYGRKIILKKLRGQKVRKFLLFVGFFANLSVLFLSIESFDEPRSRSTHRIFLPKFKNLDFEQSKVKW